jgi:hypothetical protein
MVCSTPAPPSHRFRPALSSHAHLDERRASLIAALVGHNDQFEHSDIYKVNSVVLDLADSSGRAEIPRLPHDFPERLSNTRRASQNKLLRAERFVILKGQKIRLSFCGLSKTRRIV